MSEFLHPQAILTLENDGGADLVSISAWRETISQKATPQPAN